MAANATVLVVEDEPDVQSLLEFGLQKEGFVVLTASTGTQAIEILERSVPDVISLDLMLPDIHGLDICKRARQDPRLSNVAILMLTALDTLEDIVKGFEVGADDYLVKPFKLPELIARIKALMRRRKDRRSERMVAQAGGLVVDMAHHRVTFNNNPTDNLTFKEMELLYLLVRKSPHVVKRTYLLKRLWGREDSRALDVHILHLRKKLGIGLGDQILTVPSQGYKFAPTLTPPKPTVVIPLPPTSPATPETPVQN